ncbi:MAG: DNA cytosine methyltransferase, partial [Candidatus Poseidoniaceae archaeon]
MRTKKFNQRPLPEKWEKQPTMTVTSLPDDYIHYAQPRILSVREWARIQTFPDHHVFSGPRTTGGDRRAGNPSEGRWERDVPKYTQIGNAVPPLLAEAIGMRIRELLLNDG